MSSRIHKRNRGAPAFRFLDKEHSTIARGARHQVVGPLVDKVPAQVRQAHDIGGRFHWVRSPPKRWGSYSMRFCADATAPAYTRNDEAYGKILAPS